MNKRDKSNITVAIRIRPLVEKEVRVGDLNCIKANKNTIVVEDP
jgi:kinesin family member 18/19